MLVPRLNPAPETLSREIYDNTGFAFVLVLPKQGIRHSFNPNPQALNPKS
jgi:hypothetical protein